MIYTLQLYNYIPYN